MAQGNLKKFRTYAQETKVELRSKTTERDRARQQIDDEDDVDPRVANFAHKWSR